MNNTHSEIENVAKEFKLFAWWRMLAAIVIAVAIIWGTVKVVKFFGPQPDAAAHQQSPAAAPEKTIAHKGSDAKEEHQAGAAEGAGGISGRAVETATTGSDSAGEAAASQKSAHQAAGEAPTVAGKADASHKEAAAAEEKASSSPKQVKGEAFVNALTKPISYELEERFWGWRPNDIIEFTDNVNNYQLAVLEVTRRATVSLAERISRTGSTAELDENLESAMNWFMIKADSYWFPSAEKKYQDGVKELKKYKKRLGKGQADFYTRTDNLIPLIRNFADLLGSCDQNLVKQKEKNGEPVSTFAADNYFYYAQGVASAMRPILEAVGRDFHETLRTRNGTETLHRAIHACHIASSLDPLIIFESDLDGIFANHRANLAAHISHARFYLDVLATTLST